MHAPKRFFAAVLLLLPFLHPSILLADDHVVIEQVRAGMGMRFPARVTEFWLNGASVCTVTGRFIIIDRHDLKKRWTISPQTKRYFEQPITPPVEQKKQPVTIQHAGWDYEPVYDWSVTESQQTDTVCGIFCRLVVAEGDADYSSTSVQLWVSDKVAVDAERFHERVTSSSTDFNWASLVKVHPALKKLFIVKSVNKIDRPIGPAMSYETTVTKVENIAPPPNRYEIPEGFQKVDSVEALTR
jgi:hypothetical protein